MHGTNRINAPDAVDPEYGGMGMRPFYLTGLKSRFSLSATGVRIAIV